MALVFNGLRYLAGVPVENLVLFWVVPALASTLQLFTFGTYLPHRAEGEAPYRDAHREHHEVPHSPWWLLPWVHRHGPQVGAHIDRSPAPRPRS